MTHRRKGKSKKERKRRKHPGSRLMWSTRRSQSLPRIQMEKGKEKKRKENETTDKVKGDKKKESVTAAAE